MNIYIYIYTGHSHNYLFKYTDNWSDFSKCHAEGSTTEVTCGGGLMERTQNVTGEIEIIPCAMLPCRG